MPSTTYDPRKNAISWGQPLTGFAEGSFVSIERIGVVAEFDEPGPDGETALRVGHDARYNITLTLKKGGPGNTILSEAAEATTNGAPVVRTFRVVDPSTGAEFVGENTIINKPPTWERSTAAYGNNTWVLQCANGRATFPGRG